MPKYEFIEIKNEEDLIEHEKLLYGDSGSGSIQGPEKE